MTKLTFIFNIFKYLIHRTLKIFTFILSKYYSPISLSLIINIKSLHTKPFFLLHFKIEIEHDNVWKLNTPSYS